MTSPGPMSQELADAMYLDAEIRIEMDPTAKALAQKITNAIVVSFGFDPRGVALSMCAVIMAINELEKS